MGRAKRKRALETAGAPRSEPRAGEVQTAHWGWGRPALVAALGLVLLVVAAFFPAINNAAFIWDDLANFLENPSYRGLGWAQLRWDWTAFQVGVYQPLAWMALNAEYVLFGLKLWGYHLTSLMLHALDAVVLFVLTVSLLRRCPAGRELGDPRLLTCSAALAAALFAVHPLRTEVVAWASCQPYLFCALFCMLAVLAYLQAFREGPPPRWGWMAAAFGLFLAALSSKAVAVTLPAVLLILDVYPLGRLGGGPGRWRGPAARRVWWEKVPFALLSVVFMGLAIAGRAKNEHLVTYQQAGIAARLSQACYGICFYLVKTVLPTNITAFYPLPRRVVWYEPPFILAIVGTIGVSVALFLRRRRWPGVLAAWASYLVILAPNMGLIRIGSQIAADRYSYLSMIGGVVLLAAALARAMRPRPGGLIVATLAALALLALVVLTQAQCRIWRTPEELWSHVVAHGGSDNEAVQNNLAVALIALGRKDEARAHMEEALRLNPQSPEANLNLGVLLVEQGATEKARALFQEALRLKPNSAEAHANLGWVLLTQKRFEAARAELEQALRLNPHAIDAQIYLGDLMRRCGKSDEAIALFNEVLRINPDHAGAHNGLGLILKDRGRSDEARAHFNQAIRSSPHQPDAYDNLGLLLREQGRSVEAKAAFEEARRLDPTDFPALSNLASVLLEQGRSDEARGILEQAVRLRPDDPEVHFSLGWFLVGHGRADEARKQFDETLRIDPTSARAYNNRAMIGATAAEAQYRDGPRAVADATRACELTDWKHAAYLDTLAAAHAESGDFASAVKWQTRAIALARSEAEKADFRSRLELYQARQPYRIPMKGP